MDSPAFTTDATTTVVERTIALVGGVTLTKGPPPPPPPGLPPADVGSYPNIHGDVMATAGPDGAKVGATFAYDPFGQPLGGMPDNSGGNLDYGWLGSKTRPTEHTAGMTTVEMGARPYLPAGPVPPDRPRGGGSANDYDHASGDPVNGLDLNGLKKKYVLPDAFRGPCLAGNSVQLKTEMCARYRLALVTGRAELSYHPERLNQEKDNVFGSYFGTCVTGAAVSSGIGALGGPLAAGGNALIG
ncbi:MAG: hypothetical protein ABR511_06085, partial [Acidimicrobiales bacterium]